MHAPCNSANADQRAQVVTFMTALCDYVARYKAQRAAQAPGAGTENDQADLTAGAWSREPIQVAAGRDFHGGGHLVSDL